MAEQNNLYPLPPDYFELTVDGQRKARVAACLKQGSPLDFVLAWSFFRQTYLVPSEETGVAFYKRYVESPPFHAQMVHDLASYSRNAEGAPRGGAKSTIIGKEIPLFLSVTRPLLTGPFSTNLCLATDDMVEERFDELMLTLEDNSKLIDDFGQMKPHRGGRIWNRHALRLMNGSFMRGFSVMGRKRGARPDLFILDDPEYDPSKSTNQSALNAEFDRFLFHIVIPMLDRGCGIFWIGTMINRRGYLWHACSQGPDADPRFGHWNRRVYDAEDTTTGETLWAGKWTRDFLDLRKSEIGAAAFAAEYKNSPIAEGDRILTIHPELDTYEVEGATEKDDPLTSPNLVKYCEVPLRRTGSEAPTDVVAKAGDLFSSMFRFAIIDRAYTLTPHSDYSCVHVLGMDRTTLWSLDLWLGKCKEDAFLETIFRMGNRWQLSVVGVEAVGVQQELYEKAAEHIMAFGRKVAWQPKVVPIRYEKNEAKSARIAGLEWRFNQHRIKLPRHLAKLWPYRELWNQIENFTMDLGMLEHDDAVDTLANYVQVIRGPAHVRQPDFAPDPLSFEAREEFARETGLPLGAGLKVITGDIVDRALDLERKDRYDASRDSTLRRIKVVG